MPRSRAILRPPRRWWEHFRRRHLHHVQTAQNPRQPSEHCRCDEPTAHQHVVGAGDSRGPPDGVVPQPGHVGSHAVGRLLGVRRNLLRGQFLGPRHSKPRAQHARANSESLVKDQECERLRVPDRLAPRLARRNLQVKCAARHKLHWLPSRARRPDRPVRCANRRRPWSRQDDFVDDVEIGPAECLGRDGHRARGPRRRPQDQCDLRHTRLATGGLQSDFLGRLDLERDRPPWIRDPAHDAGIHQTPPQSVPGFGCLL